MLYDMYAYNINIHTIQIKKASLIITEKTWNLFSFEHRNKSRDYFIQVFSQSLSV